MNGDDLLLLAPDVLLIPVTELDAATRRQIDCDETDFALTNPRSRATSRIIDAVAASFLAHFRQPTSIIDAVIAFSRARTLDPQQMLETAYPLLKQLSLMGYLIEPGIGEEEQMRATLAVGETFHDCEVIRPLQVVEDSEVYQLRDRQGSLFVLKIARRAGNELLDVALAREAAVLRHLNGRLAPRLIASGTHEDRPFLLIAWCQGETIGSAAAVLRRAWIADARSRLLALCLCVLDAYAELHAAGVLHGDVHPQNILVADDGAVQLIDFGQAHLAGTDAGAIRRGGVAFYLEPEYAAAFLDGNSLPPPTAHGEQYALAALCYELLIGKPYLDFALERARGFAQILRDPPLSFAAHDLPVWPPVECALARALSKDPRARFASVAEFAVALRAAQPPAVPSAEPARYDSLLDGLLARYGPESVALRDGLPAAPTCSVNFGAAGIAYTFYRLACLRDDAHLLGLADAWSERAQRDAHRPEAFTAPELEIVAASTGPISLYHTASGVHCVAALIAQARGDAGAATAALRAFIRASDQPCDELDLTLGRSSTLIGAAVLLEALARWRETETTPLIRFGDAIFAQIWARLNELDEIGRCRAVQWLGMAHGWAGYCYAALRWHQARGAQDLLPAFVLTRLRELAALGHAQGDEMSWPRGWSRDESDGWPGWCHGSAGYVLLWSLAAEVYGGAEFTPLARQAARHSLQAAPSGRPANLSLSANLCCGLAGMSYAQLALYRATGERQWLEAARRLSQQASAAIGAPQLIAGSLAKGPLAIALLGVELATPERAALPLLEKE